MSEQVTLQKAIENLSQKKHVVSEEAIRAKEQVGQDHYAEQSKTQALMSEFNRSIRILVDVFKESNFDALFLLVSQPTRLLLMNFFIGLLKGMGFAVGVLVIFGFILVTFQDSEIAAFILHLPKHFK